MANIPDAAVGFILQNLKESVQYNAELIGGVKDNVKELCEDLETLRAFIREYTEKYSAEKYSDSEILEKLANEIRSVVYRAEDSIDTYISCVSVQKLRSRFSRAFHFVDYISGLRAVGKDIGKVSKDVQQIYQNRINLAAMQIVNISNRGQKKKKTLVVEEDNAVGFYEAAEEVIALLTGELESDNLEVISIIGMLGLGKTVLAKKVLNDPKIEYEFNTRAFVNVSQEYERKEVFLKILGQFTQITEQMNKMSDGELAKELNDQLKTRKYLIVMDDVWTNEAWDQLKVAFPDTKNCSRVLITSQNKPVAVHANKKIDPYYLRFLYPDESRELLRRKVFEENCCPTELEEYELRILQKCNGLPLAIVVVAGILRNNRDRIDWWKKVAEDANDYVRRNEEQSYAIKLSYNHIPYRLKPCFLYLGVFGEDFEIPVWKLVRLWIAEGFIPWDGNTSLEDTAEDYLEELVNRNLVMVGDRRLTGQIKTCRIHDTLRDFCKTEAMKENLFREIKRFGQATSLSADPSCNSFRRLCVNAFVSDYIKSKPCGEFVRSFMSFAEEDTTLQPKHVSLIPKAFKLLRVLDVRPIIFTRFPPQLFCLALLKYIAVSCNFKILSEKVANLRNLQTLIVETSSPTLETKADLWKLAQLRHLHTNASTSLAKSKGELSINANLQTLSQISPESCRPEVFDRTPKLRKLGIRGKLANVIDPNGQSSLFASLFKLEDLENLKLLNDDRAFKLHALPQENMFPRKLTRLTLLNTLLDWKHMSTLGKLENLEVLKLKDNAFQGVLWQTEDGGFRNLKVLLIGGTNLVTWKAAASHFPMLRSLFLRYCTELEAVPSGLGDIATLQKIDLYCTNSGVATAARRIQQLKLLVRAKDKNKEGAVFKIFIYPPDQ